jgi:hypothetical protein
MTRLCKVCGEEKDLLLFRKNKKPNGTVSFMRTCKKCEYIKNRDSGVLRKSAKNWYAKNREKRLNWRREFEKNKDYLQAWNIRFKSHVGIVSDYYVRKLLRDAGIGITMENIEIKRNQILINRIKKIILKIKKNEKQT